MNTRRAAFQKTIALALVVALAAPGAFFIAPQKASAAGIGCLGSLLGLGGAGASVGAAMASVPTSDTINQQINSRTFGTTLGTCMNDVILVPIVRAALRKVVQRMTASIIDWINGGNGTGRPSYVQDLAGNLQSLGDTKALAFLSQFNQGSNSPFASSIVSSLRNDYLQSTSLAGFFGSNQDTLSQSSPDPRAFLSGDWSKGGVAEWFALTSQPQNNPYALFQNSQSQLAASVGEAQSTRVRELGWGQGFLSWCGSSPSNASSGTVGASTDACTGSDGRPGQILTPGSILHDYTQKAVVSVGFDQLISVHDLDSAFSAVVQTLFNRVLNSAAGGLFGTSNPASGPPVTNELRNYQGGSQSAADNAAQTAQAEIDNSTAYAGAWNTIGTYASTASSSVADFTGYCAAQIQEANNRLNNPNAQPSAANTRTLNDFIQMATNLMNSATAARTTIVDPAVADQQKALSDAAAKRAFGLTVQAEASGGNPSTTIAGDLTKLISMSPTVSDTAAAQSAASQTGSARTSAQLLGKDPLSTPFDITGGTTVDQMSLLSSNAQAMRPSCTLDTYLANHPTN